MDWILYFIIALVGIVLAGMIERIDKKIDAIADAMGEKDIKYIEEDED